MTGFPQPGVRARPDWSFVSSGGPGCRWEGTELTFLGFALGGVHPPAHSWLIDLKMLTGALQEVYGPRFALGDRDLLLQRAVDANAEGHPRLAGILADMIRFPPLSYAERSVALGTLSRTLGHGRKSGFNPRVSYDVALPPRLSLAFNPFHLPAGSPNGTGGQFTSREGATTVALTRREREENFQRMKDAIARRRDLPAAVREAAIEIFDVEGRGEVDPNSGARAGILGKTFARAKAAVPSLRHVKRIADLTYDQVVSVYEYVFDDAFRRHGGANRLDSFTDRRTAIAMADTVFAHGPNEGALMLQRAAVTLLKKLAPEERSRLRLPATLSNNAVETFDVLLTISNHGRAQAVRTAIADQHRGWVRAEEEEIRKRKLPEEEERRELRKWTGWRPRIRRFD